MKRKPATCIFSDSSNIAFLNECVQEVLHSVKGKNGLEKLIPPTTCIDISQCMSVDYSEHAKFIFYGSLPPEQFSKEKAFNYIPGGKSREHLIKELEGLLLGQGDYCKSKPEDDNDVSWRDVFDKSHWGISICKSKDLVIHKPNEQFARLHGMTKEEITGLSCKDLFPEDKKSEASKYITQLLDTGHCTFESEHIKKDNSIFPVHIDAAVINRSPELRMVVNLRDITERKTIENHLRESQENYRSLVNSSPDGIVLTDLQGQIITASYRFAKMFGCDNIESLSGRSVLNFIREEEREEITVLMKSSIKKGMVRDARYTCKRTDGTYFPSLINATIIYDNNLQPSAYTAYVRDMTDFAKYEKQLKESKLQYEKLLDSVPIGIFSTTPEGRFLSVNKYLTVIYGFDSVEEMTNIPVAEIYENAEDRKEFSEIIKTEGHVYELRRKMRKKDGSTFWASMNAVAIKDSNGNITHYDGSLLDISETVEAEYSKKVSESRIEALVNNSPDIMIQFDKEGRYTFVSPACKKILGVDPEWFIGKKHCDVKVPSCLEKKEELCILRVFDSGKPIEAISKSVFNEKEFIFDWRVFPQYDETSNISSLMCICRDITTHIETQQNYKMLFDKMLDGFAIHEIITDATGQPIDYIFLDVNGKFEELTGLRKENIVGKRVLEVMPNTEKKWIDNYGKVALENDTVHFEEYSQALDKYFEVTAFSPKERQFVTLFNDITSRKKAEIALNERVKELKCIVGTSVISGNNKKELKEIMQEVVDILPQAMLHPNHAIAKITYEKKEYFSFNYHATPQQVARLAGRILVGGEFAGTVEVFYTQKTPEEDIGPFLNEERILIDEIALILSRTIEKRQAVEKMEESKERYKKLAKLSTEGVIIHRDNIILDVNYSVSKIFDYTFDEIIGSTLLDTLFPVSYHEAILEHNSASDSSVFEVEGVTKSGELLPLELQTSTTIYNGANAYVTVVRNLTESKIAELQLKASEKKYRFLADNALDVVWIATPNLQLTYTSPSEYNLSGYTPEEALKRKIEDVFTEESLYILRNDLEEKKMEGLSPQATINLELQEKHKDGHKYWVELRAAPIFDDAGKLTGYQGVTRNIDDRKQAVDLMLQAINRAKRSEKRFRDVLLSTSDWVWEIDMDFNYTYASGKVKELLGFSAREIIGKSLFDYIIPNRKIAAEAAFNDIFQRKSNFRSLEFWKMHKEGSLVCVEQSGIPVFDENGNLSGYRGVDKNITQLKIQEKKDRAKELQLIQADKMTSLGILVSGVAHEINNPNNFILLNAEIFSNIWKEALPILQDYYKLNDTLKFCGMSFDKIPDEIGKLLEGIVEGSNRIKDIVKSLRDFAAPDKDEWDKEIDLNKVIESSIMILSSYISKNTNNFKVDLDTELPKVTGNFQRMEQVIINLITNACQALENKDQSVEISSVYHDMKKEIEIIVKDEGKGIPEDQQKKIFDPFFTTKISQGGTGLGLSISYNIIKKFRGRLSYKSKPGQGTQAIITIPAFNQ